MRAAVSKFLEGDSIRNVAKLTDISKSTLQRYVNVAKNTGTTGQCPFS